MATGFPSYSSLFSDNSNKWSQFSCPFHGSQALDNPHIQDMFPHISDSLEAVDKQTREAESLTVEVYLSMLLPNTILSPNLSSDVTLLLLPYILLFSAYPFILTSTVYLLLHGKINSIPGQSCPRNLQNPLQNFPEH